MNFFETCDVWFAACLVYLYGKECLAKITDTAVEGRRRVATYALAVASEDVKILQKEYETDQLALASAKSFAGAYNSILHRQWAMRERGDTQWCSYDWILGKVG
jgi:hypothetical protein